MVSLFKFLNSDITFPNVISTISFCLYNWFYNNCWIYSTKLYFLLDRRFNILYVKYCLTVKQQNIVRKERTVYKIKEIREKKRMSQTELSDLSGVSRATINRIENEKDVVVNTKTLQKIANALNVSIKFLFMPWLFNKTLYV